MDPTQIGIFDLAARRLSWTEQRQAVLARNIANVSTPSFQPSDLPPFAAALSRVAIAGVARTQPGHLAGTIAATAGSTVASRPQARAPDGNAVSLDEQLAKVADTENTQSMVSGIYQKYIGLFGLALGRSS